MFNSKKSRRILWYQASGFLLIIALSWLDELWSLPSRLFGGVEHSNWHESALETTIILAVWLPIFVLTKRLLARLFYLEHFLRICAWCRKIGHDDQWLPIEEYFSSGFQVETSHSICPECAREHFPKAPNDI
jgi:hypothetical protein